LSIDSTKVLLVDPLALEERGHLIDDDLFLTSCLLTLTPHVKVLTSETSAANINSKHMGVANGLKSFGFLGKIGRLRSVLRVVSIRTSGCTDVVFQSFEEAQAIVFILLHPRTRVHLIVTNNLALERSNRHPVIWRRLIRMALQRASSVIVHSEYEVCVVKDVCPVFNESRIFIKPFHQVAAKRDRPEWLERSNTILFLGPILERKPIEPVIDMIKHDSEQRFRYVLRRVDELDADQRRFLESQPNVDISSGYISDAEYYDLFSSSTLVLKTHNRLFEGKLSGPFCDAIASNTPVIATDMSPHNEYFKKFGPMGFLVDYSDPDWADEIINSDLTTLYDEFQGNMAVCREAASIEANSLVFRSMLKLE